MDIKDCLTFASENPNCFLATVEGNQPRVRTIMLMFADETGFYFETFPNKRMSKQMHANRSVELLFFNNSSEFMETKHMRVAGEVEFLDDPGILDRIYDLVKGMEPLAGGPFKHLLEIYRVNPEDIHFWTPADIGKEDDIEHLKC